MPPSQDGSPRRGAARDADGPKASQGGGPEADGADREQGVMPLALTPTVRQRPLTQDVCVCVCARARAFACWPGSG